MAFLRIPFFLCILYKLSYVRINIYIVCSYKPKELKSYMKIKNIYIECVYELQYFGLSARAYQTWNFQVISTDLSHAILAVTKISQLISTVKSPFVRPTRPVNKNLQKTHLQTFPENP